MAANKSEKMTGGQALVGQIIANGVDTIFGLPGIQLDGMFNALYDNRNRVRVINARHEQGVAYMAFGYAISTGKVGAYAVVPGPGILNTTAALSTAYGCNQPVMAITGQIPSWTIGKEYGMLHEIPDQLGVMERLTKWAARIDHPSDAPGVVNEAFRQLTSGRPRPVSLEMPMDMALHEATVTPLGAAEPDPTPAIDPDCVAEAGKLLGGAKQPMIFVGSGAYHAGAEIKQLAELLQAPVISYQNGRGILDERHYLAQVHPAGNKLWGDCDVAITVGCRLQPERMLWGMDDEIKIIQVDIDPTELNRITKADVGIVADAAEGVAAIVEATAKHNSKRASREEEMLGLKDEVRANCMRVIPEQMAWLDALRLALPEDGYLVDEFTQVAYIARIGFPIYHPRTMITPGYQGTLGYGFATALGVKVAHPDKPVLSLNGDGGFMYTMPELATAVHHGINLVSVVFADGAYGNVKRMQKELHGGKVIGSDFTNPDFVKLAESFGAAGYRAETPEQLTEFIKKGFDNKGPTLIEVPVGEFTEPWPVIRPAPTKPRVML
ncbi:MAG: hypothetical protein HOL85_10590 [Rhodospirillaceae bacterium]|jgi:acetolactate synthase I/II/III large subunit|nr:hypothetical protein [Rhodospirillaceae bacterium]MBT6137640.1 hypothetical protein [Rhodospirillaceae bacterium]